MGIITFICVNTFLSCISVDNFINDTIRNDFTIETLNEEDTTSKANLLNNDQTNEITSDSIEEIKNLQGIKEINVLKYSFLNFDYKIFDKYLDIYCKATKMPEDMIDKLKDNYKKMMVKLDPLLIVLIIAL